MSETPPAGTQSPDGQWTWDGYRVRNPVRMSSDFGVRLGPLPSGQPPRLWRRQLRENLVGLPLWNESPAGAGGGRWGGTGVRCCGLCADGRDLWDLGAAWGADRHGDSRCRCLQIRLQGGSLTGRGEGHNEGWIEATEHYGKIIHGKD